MDNKFSEKTLKNMPLLIEAIQSNDEEEIEKAIKLLDEKDQSFFDEEELLEIAISKDAYDYVDYHLDYVDVYDFRWTAAAENEEMIDYLMEHGASRDPDCYLEYAFSYCVDTDCVITFNEEFRKELIKKYIDKIGLSENELCEYLGEDLNFDYEGKRDLKEDASALGFFAKDGKIVIGESDDSGRAIIDILDWLGYDYRFQGYSWKFETSGYYFVD